MTQWLRVLLGAAAAGGLVAVLLTVALRGQDEGRGEVEGGGDPPPVPSLALDAYVDAAAAVPDLAPNCAGMTWPILAGIGAVESAHAGGRTLAPNGDVTPWVIGPRLDGSGVGGNRTPYPDTDGGELDGDTTYDRAVGPMQFLPETWENWGRDGNGDGRRDPHNIFDASLAAAAYLCGRGVVDLADRTQLTEALIRYNRSASYVADVLSYADSYATAPDPPS